MTAPVAVATWAVPLELVMRLVGPVGLATIIRAQVSGRGRLQRVATLSVRGGRFVAEIDYEGPLAPEQGLVGVVVQLAVRPEWQA